jgi:1-acyl-sn-glycerol-3-phosphate acyltransferase
MIRTIWVVKVVAGMTILCAPAVTIIALFSSHHPWIDSVIRLWARTIIRAAGVQLRIDSTVPIDWSRSYVFIANHHSYMDIPCLLAAIPQPVRFMAKKSLFHVPIFGWGLRATGFIPIDRADSSKATRSLGMATDRIRKGNSIVIFPEGSRSRERSMSEFKRGAFLLALRGKLPIIPVAIDGTYEVMPATRLRIVPGPVTIRLARPLEPGELRVRDLDGMIARTRGAIERMLEKRKDER